MNQIEKIEEELSKLITVDSESWTKIYKLMEQVEKDKLFEQKYKSYTAWVNDFAERNKVNVSLLWRRKKAGKYYAQYEERQRINGNDVVSMQDLHISPDNIVLVEKIAGNNESVADELINKVIKGELKRDDLKNAWQTVKADRERKGQKQHRTNAYDSNACDDNLNKADTMSVSATDIVLAFNSNNWLPNRSDAPYIPRKYRVFTEFAVQTGTSRHARRMDILALETIGTDDISELNLHCIEIKISKSDLINDTKMQEYTAFCDYFWIAVPSKLVSDAEKIVTDNWGIIAFNKENGDLSVIKDAKKSCGAFRNQTIINALIKLF